MSVRICTSVSDGAVVPDHGARYSACRIGKHRLSVHGEPCMLHEDASALVGAVSFDGSTGDRHPVVIGDPSAISDHAASAFTERIVPYGSSRHRQITIIADCRSGRSARPASLVMRIVVLQDSS